MMLSSEERFEHVVSMVLAAAGVVVAKRAQSAMSVSSLITRRVTRCARRVCAALPSTSTFVNSFEMYLLELGNVVTFVPGFRFKTSNTVVAVAHLWRKRVRKQCAKDYDDSRQYQTMSAAKEACLKMKPSCAGVYDNHCDGRPPHLSL